MRLKYIVIFRKKDKSRIQYLVSKEVYSALWFDRYVLSGILKYCDEFLTVRKKGFHTSWDVIFKQEKIRT